MVSLPELDEGLRYWPVIWWDNSAWEARGPHGLLPTRDRPKITSIEEKLNFEKKLECCYFWTIPGRKQPMWSSSFPSTIIPQNFWTISQTLIEFWKRYHQKYEISRVSWIVEVYLPLNLPIFRTNSPHDGPSILSFPICRLHANQDHPSAKPINGEQSRHDFQPSTKSETADPERDVPSLGKQPESLARTHWEVRVGHRACQ